ncbi:MAG TPA: hypothetical protein VM010_04970, partial [Chitinophagaceae bacterium]|nr:hypothetical protein [Chitinophagaceae bacterium]
NISYAEKNTTTASALSPAFVFLDAGIPTHDSITVRMAVNGAIDNEKMRLVVTSAAGDKTVVQKGTWCRGWVCARFRQFGTFQVFVDTTAPTVNAPGTGDTINLQRATRLVFNAKDNFKKIKTFRAEMDGQWLLFSNDKNLSYIYQFDTYFTPGMHQLHVTVEDVAGNKTEKAWWVRR